MEVIDRKQTDWIGLWWHPESNYFSSPVISLAELRKFKGNVRLIVRKNGFYNGGENGRPNYVFLLRDAKSENPFEIGVENIDDDGPYKSKEMYYTEKGDRLYTEDEVRRIINGTVAEVERGTHDPYDILPSDYV